MKNLDLCQHKLIRSICARCKEQGVVEEAVRCLLNYIGENPERDGLKDTPRRVAKAWKEMTVGYSQDPKEILQRDFGLQGYDQVIACPWIEFSSTCVTGETFIDTPSGQYRIKDLVGKSMFVYSYNEKDKVFEVAKASNIRMTRRKAEVWQLTTDHGCLVATPDHRFLTFDRGWVALEDLLPYESLVPFNRYVFDDLYSYISPTPIGKACYVAEHRFVCSQVHGLPAGYDTHHKDENKLNNAPENLEALTDAEHGAFHVKEANKAVQRLKISDPVKYAGILKLRKGGQVKFYQSVEGMLNRKKKSEMMKKIWEFRRRGRQRVNHKVLSIKPLGKEDVYCMEVDKNHNFVANGVVVHNCEHHMLPFLGYAHVGYVPKSKTSPVVGLSKLGRLVDCFARRLQIQEQLTMQIADALEKHLQTKGVAVVIQAKHLCMSCRGVQKHDSVMVTSAMRGVFMKEGPARSEFFKLVELAAHNNK